MIAMNLCLTFPAGRTLGVAIAARRHMGVQLLDVERPVGVIGGGLAGVTAARLIAAAGLPVVLHERDPQCGGRLGAVQLQRSSPLVAGMGCSYIKATDPLFQAQLDAWAQDGLVQEWTTANPHTISAPGVWSSLPLEEGERWYSGRPHMGSLAELTADEQRLIDVQRGEVYDANFEASTWVLATQVDDTGAEGAATEGTIESHLHSDLIIATPVSDAQAFLERKLLDRALGRARHKDFLKERVAATFVFERGLDLPFNFAVLSCSPITVAICDSDRLGESGSAPEVWVVQSDTKWAAKALDDRRELPDLASELLAEFGAALGLGELPAVRESVATVWAYGDMDYGLEGGCVWLDDLRLGLAGDWAYDGRVEGAWLSGRAAARKLLAARGLDTM